MRSGEPFLLMERLKFLFVQRFYLYLGKNLNIITKQNKPIIDRMLEQLWNLSPSSASKNKTMVTYRLDSQSVNFLLDCQEYLNTLNPLIRDSFYESVKYSSLTCY